MSQRSDQHLVWMDMEMTGLDPERDTILEIATLITTDALELVAEGPALAIGHPQSVLDAMDKWNREHHAASGLTARVLTSSIKLVAVTCEEHVELVLSQREQFAVLHSAPAHLLNRRAVVPGEGTTEPPVQALVDADAHVTRRSATRVP